MSKDTLKELKKMSKKDKQIKELNYLIEGLFEELRQCKMGDNVGVDNYDYWVREYQYLLDWYKGKERIEEEDDE